MKLSVNTESYQLSKLGRGVLFVLGLSFLFCTDIVRAAPGNSSSNDWPMYNADALGTRSNSSDSAPAPSSLKQKGLEIKWTFPASGTLPDGGAFNGTPIVVDNVIYAGDSSGNFYAIDKNGNLLWMQSGFGYITSTALVTDKRVIIGTNSDFSFGGNSPGKIVGMYRKAENGHAPGDIVYTISNAELERTGLLLSFDGSPTLAKGALKGKDLVVIGIASHEEYATNDPNYDCCSTRGGVVAFDPDNGQIAWRYDTVITDQQTAGSSGASVWSTPTYDATTKRIYVSTGNNFSEPSTATSDAIIALNAKDGKPAWVHQLTYDDTWNSRFPTDEDTPDSDFGDSVNIFNLADGTRVIAAGQKSGFVHLLDANDGHLIDQYQLVPFGTLGGLFADSAYANGVLFVNGISQWCEVNFLTQVTDCSDQFHHYGFTSPTTLGIVKGGIVAAMDVSTPELKELWRFEPISFPDTAVGKVILGAVAHAKGVIYAAEGDFFGGGRDKLYALDAKTGEVLADIPLPAIALSGPSVSGDRIYLGTGLREFGVPGQIISIGVKN